MTIFGLSECGILLPGPKQVERGQSKVNGTIRGPVIYISYMFGRIISSSLTECLPMIV